MRWAHGLATRFLPTHSSKFSRHDFTKPQLFACLVLREHQKKSYRGLEALLEDCPDWRADIGLPRTPDHNTLCRTFNQLVRPGLINRMLDQTAAWAEQRKLIRGRIKPIALDSSMFESRHVSRHFEKRQTQSSMDEAKRGGKQAKTAGNRRRSRAVRGLPKLSLAVATVSHVILAARATTGGGADQPHFQRLLADAQARADVRLVVADAGYDSEANHVTARENMGVRSIIPPHSGRPTLKPPPSRHRRNMHWRFKRKADKAHYGQRWQSETVNSMIKRNLDSALRARTAPRRRNELLLRVITHNLMILKQE
jgi:hypothetical protein